MPLWIPFCFCSILLLYTERGIASSAWVLDTFRFEDEI